EIVEFSIEPTDREPNAKSVVRVDRKFPLERFAFLQNFDENLASLAALAQPENWTYLHQSPEGKYPVLFSYIHHTYSRLEHEEKIADVTANDARQYACFNTGLVTRMQQPIYAFFDENRRSEPKW